MSEGIELKHDFSTPKGIAFKAILDKSRELGISDRLSIHHLNEMSNAVLNTRPEATKIIEANILINDLKQYIDTTDRLRYRQLESKITKISQKLKGG